MKEPESTIDIKWDSIMLAFINKEMTDFISELRQKKPQQSRIQCLI